MTAQIITAKESALATPPQDSESKDMDCVMLKSNTCRGLDGVSSMRDQMMTFLAEENGTAAMPMI